MTWPEVAPFGLDLQVNWRIMYIGDGQYRSEPQVRPAVPAQTHRLAKARRK